MNSIATNNLNNHIQIIYIYLQVNVRALHSNPNITLTELTW